MVLWFNMSLGFVEKVILDYEANTLQDNISLVSYLVSQELKQSHVSINSKIFTLKFDQNELTFCSKVGRWKRLLNTSLFNWNKLFLFRFFFFFAIFLFDLTAFGDVELGDRPIDSSSSPSSFSSLNWSSRSTTSPVRVCQLLRCLSRLASPYSAVLNTAPHFSLISFKLHFFSKLPLLGKCLFLNFYWVKMQTIS